MGASAKRSNRAIAVYHRPIVAFFRFTDDSLELRVNNGNYFDLPTIFKGTRSKALQLRLFYQAFCVQQKLEKDMSREKSSAIQNNCHQRPAKTVKSSDIQNYCHKLQAILEMAAGNRFCSHEELPTDSLTAPRNWPAIGGRSLSPFSFVIMLAYIPIIAKRICNEEEVLADGLTGYTEYMGRIRWRLVPGIW